MSSSALETLIGCAFVYINLWRVRRKKCDICEWHSICRFLFSIFDGSCQGKWRRPEWSLRPKKAGVGKPVLLMYSPPRSAALPTHLWTGDFQRHQRALILLDKHFRFTMDNKMAMAGMVGGLVGGLVGAVAVTMATRGRLDTAILIILQKTWKYRQCTHACIHNPSLNMSVGPPQN